MARQETLLEHKLFYAIRPWEFQNLNFAKKDKRCAPNIHAFVTHFNTMSGWFTKVILDCSALQKRTRTVELLIDLAEAFCQLNNYNGLLEVMAALLSSSVFRLKRTWNGISRGHKVRFKEYMALASNAKNFAELRGRLKFVYGACVPYIGLYQTDLTFIEEGNPTRRGKLINWQKCKLQAGIIKTINEYRMNTYSLVHIPWMQDFLAKIQVTETENDFWSRSIALESRAELQASAGSNSSTGSSLTASAASSQSSSGSSSNASHMKEPRPRSLSSSSTTTGKASPSPMQNSAALGPAANAVFKVSMPGFTSFFDVPYPEKGRGGGDGCEIYPGSGLLLKQHIFDSIIGKLMQSKAKNIMEGMRDKMRELSLVEFSAEHLFGRGIGDDEQYDIADVYGLKFFSLFKRCCPVEITSGKSSAVMLAGLESPLHPLISAIITIFNINGNSGGSGDGGCGDGGNDSSNNSNDSSNGESNEFGLLMLDKDNNVLRWLNRNMSLREQGFQESNKIYVYPTAALSEKELDKAAFSRNPACKAGFLTKVGVRPLVRYGLQPRSSQLATASTSPSSSSNGNNNNSSGSSNKGTLRPPNPSIASLAHEAATIASLANMSGQVSHVLSSTLAVTSPPPSSSSLSLSLHHHQQQQQQSASSGSSSSSTEDAEKNWLLAVDGFLFYYKEYSAARPRRVFMLEYYNVTLGSLSGGQPCIILRLRADYPFRTRDARIALFTSKNEADLRAWYADLRRRSCMYRYTKVFGVPPAELALRSGAATFIPRQIQACAAQVFMHGAGVDALFASTQPPLATFERIKDSLDAGEVPEPRNAAELSVVAQALLSYFAELSEPLFTQEMVAALTPKDRDKDKDKDKDKEKEKEKERSATASTVLAEWLGKKLSQPHAFALLTLLLLLRTWGDSMPTGARKAAAVLSQYMPGPEKVTLRMAEDLLKAAAKAVIPPERCSFRTYVASLQKRVVAEYTSFKPIEGVALIAKEERSVIAQRIKAAFAIGAYKAPQQQQQKTVITQQQQQQQEKGVVVKQDSENSSPVLSTHSGVGSPSGSIGSPQIKWVSSYRKKPTLSPSTGSETCSPRLGGDDLSSDSLALECDSTVVAATITTTASSAAVAPPLAQGSLKIGSRNIGLASETKEE